MPRKVEMVLAICIFVMNKTVFFLSHEMDDENGFGIASLSLIILKINVMLLFFLAKSVNVLNIGWGSGADYRMNPF